MEATVVKTKGVLQDSKVMLGGITLLNPNRTYIDVQQKEREDKAGYILNIRSRVPGLSESYARAIIKSYDGILGYKNGNEFTVIKTEIIGGAVVKTYSAQMTESTGYTDPFTGDKYLGRYVCMLDENQVPWRIDVIGDNYGNDVDITLPGSNSDGYDYPMTVDAEQIKYSTIPSEGGLLILTRNTGVVKTEWFRNNEGLRRIDVRGPNADAQGTILDFVSAAKSLFYFNFGSMTGIKGSMTDYLNAVKESGVKSKYIDIHISGSGITNDVYVYDDRINQETGVKNPDPGVGKTGVYYAVFDANGDWRCSKSLPEDPDPEEE